MMLQRLGMRLIKKLSVREAITMLNLPSLQILYYDTETPTTMQVPERFKK